MAVSHSPSLSYEYENLLIVATTVEILVLGIEREVDRRGERGGLSLVLLPFRVSTDDVHIQKVCVIFFISLCVKRGLTELPNNNITIVFLEFLLFLLIHDHDHHHNR